jgi:geranylgeranyl pyrophosphate synthase
MAAEAAAAQDLAAALEGSRREVEGALRTLVRGGRGVPERLRRAMAHSLLGGGKRLRPILLLWCHDAFAVRARRGAATRDAVLRAACALEMLHTYSLIHDDLPAMDDDDLRRGRPSCHKAFDEATAILAGDGLQAWAFEILAAAGGERAGKLVAAVAAAVGPAGMVGGQQLDLDAEGGPVTPAQVRRIHVGKTARLLAAALEAGALLGGAGDTPRRRVAEAGLQLGLAFQASDDVLDVTGDAAVLGKTAGKDAAAGKATWVALEGVEAATRRVRRLGLRGERLLTAALPAGPAADRLTGLARKMWERDR